MMFACINRCVLAYHAWDSWQDVITRLRSENEQVGLMAHVRPCSLDDH
jgi:hypothetical protein